MKSFTEKVIEVVSSIPKGKVMTYQQVARKAGSPRAARAVGMVLKKNKDVSVPCHRVIKSDGRVGSTTDYEGKLRRSCCLKRATELDFCPCKKIC